MPEVAGSCQSGRVAITSFACATWEALSFLRILSMIVKDYHTCVSAYAYPISIFIASNLLGNAMGFNCNAT